MLSAILCSGPSLRIYDSVDHSKYNLIICVNRAVNHYKCTYWSILDSRTLDFINNLPYDCTWLTRRTSSRKMTVALKGKRLPQFCIIENITPNMNSKRPVRWEKFSSLCAIIFARFYGAKTIDCYGMDWLGTEDYDGFHHECQNRDEQRWNLERTKFQRIQKWFAKEGINLQRICS